MNTEKSEFQEDLLKDIKNQGKQKMLDWTDEKYFNDTRFVTSSMLSKISQGGVQHLKAYLEADFERKKHNDVGNHFHTIVLEPHREKELYFVIDDRAIMVLLKAEYKSPKATKKYKEWLQGEIENSEGKIVIEYTDYENNIRMKEKLFSYKPIRDLIQNENNVFEKIYYNTDPKTGVERKGKVDIRNVGHYLADLKSTKDPVTAANVLKIILKYGYDRAAAHYLDVTGEDQFYFIFAEKTYPFTCGIVEMSEAAIKEGREKNHKLIMRYKLFFGKDAKASPDDDFLMLTM